MACRSLRPLPISTRISIRLESMSPTRSMTTSPPRRPAPYAMLSAALYFRPGPGAASISRATWSAASTRGSLRGLVRASQLMGEVSTAERDGEEEAQRRGLRIHLRRLRTLLDLRKLEAADVVAVRGIR